VPGPTVSPLVEMLNEACQHVSRRLGYAGPWPRVETAERPDAALEGSSCAKPG
jgi:hypothetical protein